MMIGRSRPKGVARMVSQHSKPSMPGMSTSSSTRSGRTTSIAFDAASPEDSVWTEKPALSSALSASRRIVSSSSTTRM
jgi:hypothetical protein